MMSPQHGRPATPGAGRGPGRRIVLLGAMVGAASLASCTSGSATSTGPTTESSAGRSSTSGASPSPSPSSPATTSGAGPTGKATTTATGAARPALPAATPWSPDANDVRPAVKLAAVRVVEALLTYPASGAGASAARQRVAALGQDPGLVDAALELVGTTGASGASVADVLDVQYGGILPTSSSVLVVTRVHTQAPDGTVTESGTTVDVRLVSASPRWRVTELHPAVPGPAVSALSVPARQVLASSRISLPPASSADIRSGQVHDSVLQALLILSASHTIGVSVVRSGHPTYVFGTGRLSDHPRGRAFDTWQIDGHAVVSSATSRSLIVSYMQAAAAAGSSNVGGPYLLSGGTYFSDDTHHDHVHAGFRN